MLVLFSFKAIASFHTTIRRKQAPVLDISTVE
uniref:Uncharacterized protein n=1 Tax=Anguilla anguilla TaxID=7936 RepID=A0A0E9PF46_ANGAN